MTTSARRGIWRYVLFSLAVCGALLCVTSARGQALDGLTLDFGATFQGRFSYGWIVDEETAADPEDAERLGFGLRRLRLRGTARLGRLGAYLQVGAAGAAVTALDAYLFYQIAEEARIRFGRFAPAQPRAYQGTSHTRIDGVERAAIANLWGDATLASGGRVFGLGAVYETERATVQFSLHNGTGSWGDLGNFSSDVTASVGGADNLGMGAGVYAAYRPSALSGLQVDGLEVGGYVGYNAAEPTSTAPGVGAIRGTTRSYLSYSAHLYWGAAPGSQPVRLKLDVIGIRYETLTVPAAPGEGPFEQHTLGVALLGAVRVHPSAEVFARVGRYDPAQFGTGADVLGLNPVRFLMAGGSFSLSALRGGSYHAQRITLAYAAALPEGFAPARHLIALQLQLVL